MSLYQVATTAREHLRSDLQLLHQAVTDTHVSSVSTSMQCLDDVARHTENFFSFVAEQRGGSNYRDAVGHDDPGTMSAVENVLFPLLHGPHSLLEFLKRAVGDESAASSAASAKAVEEGFSVLCMLVTQACGYLSPTQCGAIRLRAMDSWVLLSRLNVHHAAQARCVKLLVLLLLNTSRSQLSAADVGLSRTLEYIERTVAKPSAGLGVRSNCLQLAGLLASTFPAECVALSSRILQLCMSTMQEISRKKVVDHVVGEGAILGLDALLSGFGDMWDKEGEPPNAASSSRRPPYVASPDRVFIVQFVKCALALAEDTPRYPFPKAALKLLKHHAHLFRHELLDDGVAFFQIIHRLCGHKNVELHKTAYPAAVALLDAFAYCLCHEDQSWPTPAASTVASASGGGPLETLRAILATTKSILMQPKREPYELSFAISAYGVLARPIARHVGRHECSLLFEQLSARCSALLNAGRSEMEGAARHFPQFLATYAALLGQISDVTPSLRRAVVELVESVLLLFPHDYYFPKVRAATPAALKQLFVACCRFPALADVPRVFVERGLIVSISGSGMFGEHRPPPRSAVMSATSNGTEAEERGDAPPPATVVDGALYDAYVPLWCSLLQVNVATSGTSGGTPRTIAEAARDVGGAAVQTTPCSEEVEFHVQGLQRDLLDCICASLKAFDLDVTTVDRAPGTSAPRGPLAQEFDGGRVGVGLGEAAILPSTAAHISSLSTAHGMLTPRCPKDYALFLSLVPLWDRLAVHLLSTRGGPMLETVAQYTVVLVHLLAERSLSLPHVSGFFSMLSSALRHAPRALLAQPAVRSVLLALHEDTRRRLPEMSQELLLSCSMCLLQFPVNMVPVSRQALPLEVVFRLGVEVESAAECGIDTLARFMKEDGVGTLSLLPALLPQMLAHVGSSSDGELLLGDKGAAAAVLMDEAVHRLHGPQGVGVAQKVGSFLCEHSLQIAAAQRDAQRAAGTRLVAGDANAEAAAGFAGGGGGDATTLVEALRQGVLQCERRFSLRLSLRDATLELPILRVLPRVASLALTSVLRATRVTACELLHALILWVIGSLHRGSVSTLSDSGDADDLRDLQRALFLVVVQLATSVDGTVNTLYRSLLLQLARWFAQASGEGVVPSASTALGGSMRTRSPEVLVSALTDGLSTGGPSASMRELSCEAIAEFLRWSAKSVRDSGAEHVRLVCRHLAGLLHHPGERQRLGAAMCMNRAYTVLREMKASIVSENILDLLYHCFSALLLCDEERNPSGAIVPLVEAVGHLEKIIAFYSDHLVAPNPSRSGVLTDLATTVTWLFQQCGSTQKTSRNVAMRLFTTLASCLPGFEADDGPARWLSTTRQSMDIYHGIFHAFSLADPRPVATASGPKLAFPVFVEWAREIEASVTCHLWLIAARYLPPHLAFGNRADRERKRHRAEAVLLGVGAVSPGSKGTQTTGEPKSQLFLHLSSFVGAVLHKRVSSGTAESQQVYCDSARSEAQSRSTAVIESGDVDQPQFGDQSAVESREQWCVCCLHVLGALASLVECVAERFPNCCWSSRDDEVLEGRVGPLIHLPLYQLCAQLLLTPENIFGDMARAAAVEKRIQRVAERLTRACGFAVHSVCPAEIDDFIQTFVSAVPDALRDANLPREDGGGGGGCASLVTGFPVAAVRGVRWLQSVHPWMNMVPHMLRCHRTLGAAIAGAPGTPTAAANAPASSSRGRHEALLAALFHAFARHIEEHRAVVTNPLAVEYLTEYLGLLLDDPHLVVAEVVNALVAERDGLRSTAQLSDSAVAPRSTSTRADSEDDSPLRRSTTHLLERRVLASRSVWLVVFRGVIVAFLAKHQVRVIERCVAIFQHDAGDETTRELLRLLAANTGSPESVSAWLEVWPVLTGWVAAAQRNRESSSESEDEGDSARPASTTMEDMHELMLTVLLVLVRSERHVGEVSAHAVAYLRALFGASDGDPSRLFQPHTLLRSRSTLRCVRLALRLAADVSRAIAAAAASAIATKEMQNTTDPVLPALEPLRDCMATLFEAVVRDELPISVMELDAGSEAYVNALDVVEGLFLCLSHVAAPLVAEMIRSLLPLLDDAHHPCRGSMIRSLDACVARLTPQEVSHLIAMLLNISRQALPIGVRQAVTYQIVAPCLRHLRSQADLSAVLDPFVGHLVQTVERTGFGSVSSVDSAVSLCVTRTCAFSLLAVVYRLCSAEALRGPLNAAYLRDSGLLPTGTAPTGKELTEKLIRTCVSARQAAGTDDGGCGCFRASDRPLLLAYRQAAYSCLASVLVATQRQEKLFVQFLLRDKARDLLKDIVDCDAVHEFRIETRFEELSAALIQTRLDGEAATSALGTGSDRSSTGTRDGTSGGETEQLKGARRVRYLSSQYLQDSHVPVWATDAFNGVGGDVSFPSPPSAKSHDAVAATSVVTKDDVSAVGIDAAIMATPRRHRDKLVATLLSELDDARRDPRHHNPLSSSLGAQQFVDDAGLLLSSSEDNLVQTGTRGATESSSPPLIELDSVWRSACCNTLLFLVDALIRLFPFPAGSSSGQHVSHSHPPSLTSWVHELIAMLRSHDSHLNVKLVIARMILMRAGFFDAFAAELFEPLCALVLLIHDSGCGKGIHYYTRDVLLMLLRWRSPLPPANPNGTAAANALVSHVIRNLSHRAKRILRENLEVLKLLLERWKHRIHVNKVDLVGWLTYAEDDPGAPIARICGLQVCGILCANQMPLYELRLDAAAVTEQNFYECLASNLTAKTRDVASAAAEVTGMALQQLTSLSTTHDDRSALLRALVVRKLSYLHQTGDLPRFLLLLRKVAEYFPEVLTEYVPGKLTGAIFSGPGVAVEDQVVVLELLGMRPERANVVYPTLHGVVATFSSMRAILKAALFEVLLRLCPHLTSDLLDHLLRTFVTATVLYNFLGQIVDARVAFYKICIHAVDARAAELPRATVAHLQHLLVRGLDDSSLFVRDILIRYWDNERRLPLDSVARFDSLLRDLLLFNRFGKEGEAEEEQNFTTAGPLASPSLTVDEDHGGPQNSPPAPHSSLGSWLQHGAILMLSLAHRQADFQRTDSLFPQPLQHCVFRPLSVDEEGASSSFATGASAQLPSQLKPMFASQVPLSKLPRTEGLGENAFGGEIAISTDAEAQAESTRGRGGLRNPPPGMVVASQANQLFPATLEGGQFTVFERTLLPSSLPTSSLLFTTARRAPERHTAEFAASHAASMAPSPGSSLAASTLVLRRRFFHSDDDDTVRRHIVHASRLRQNRELLRESEEQSRRQRVVVFRAYRDGEVPDIQISMQSIVVPLQALLLHDAELAKTSLTMIAGALFTHLRRDAADQRRPMTVVSTLHTATFLVDMANRSAGNPLDAKQADESLLSRLLEVYETRGGVPLPTLMFVQEVLSRWGRALPTPARAFSNLFADPLRVSPDALQSTLLQLERSLAAQQDAKARLHGDVTPSSTDDESAAAPSTRQHKDSLESSRTAAWAIYARCLSHAGEEDDAQLAARQFAAFPDRLDRFHTLQHQGDWDAAQREMESMLDLIPRVIKQERNAPIGAAAGGEVGAMITHTDSLVTERSLTRRSLMYEARDALACMLQWGDALTGRYQLTADDAVHETPAGAGDRFALAADWNERIHEVGQIIRCSSMAYLRAAVHAQSLREGPGETAASSTSPSPLKELPSVLPANVFSLDRVLRLAALGEYFAASHAARCGIAATQLTLVSRNAAVADSAVELRLYSLFRDVCDQLGVMRSDPPTAVRRVQMLLQRLSAALPSDASPWTDDPRQLDTLVSAVQFAGHLTRRAFEQCTQQRLPREDTCVLLAHPAAVAWTSGLWLSRSAMGVHAGKKLLHRASQLTTAAIEEGCKDGPLKASLWQAVAEATLHRMTVLPPATPAALRRAWTELESNLEGKASLVREGHVAQSSYTRLQTMLHLSAVETTIAAEGLTAANSREITNRLNTASSLLSGVSGAQPREHTKLHSDLLRVVDACLSLAHEEAAPSDVRGEMSSAADLALRSALGAHFAQQLLRGLCHNERYARELFPRWLELCEGAGSGQQQEARQLLGAAATTLNTVSVLPWCAQLLSAMSRRGNVAPLVAPLVQRMAAHHPQVLLYPFYCVRDDLLAAASRPADGAEPMHDTVKQTLLFLDRLFSEEVSLRAARTFVHSIGMLHNPEKRCVNIVDDMIRRNSATASQEGHPAGSAARRAWAQRLWAEMNRDVLLLGCSAGPDTQHGDINTAFAKDFGPVIREKLCSSPVATELDLTLLREPKKFQEQLSSLKKYLDEEMRKRPRVKKGLVELSKYSRELACLQLGKYGVDVLEVPRQPFAFLFDDSAAPGSAHRVLRVDPMMLVLDSQQAPKRIRLHTSDERVVPFLVKGGEDLRLDQRIEQLFCAMNGILVRHHQQRVRDAVTSSEGSRNSALSLRTYSVVPVTKRAGLVEWVNGTTVMKDLIELSMRRMDAAGGDRSSIRTHPVTLEYVGLWPDVSSYLKHYQSLPNTNGAYTSRIQSMAQRIYPHYLRDGLQAQVETLPAFYRIRQRFRDSVTAASVAGYLLGVGDRHLENFLVDRSTGSVVMIDFGHAFGSATTHLPVPELMPFRLSPQMGQTMGPLGCEAMAPHMERLMLALRSESSLILSVASAFLYEPLLAWEVSSRDFTAERVGEDISRRKLQTLRRKLRLDNPVHILEDLLSNNDAVVRMGVTEDVQRVARGDPVKRSSGAATVDCREFVEVLLSTATDWNVLGRTYAGWSPLF